MTDAKANGYTQARDLPCGAEIYLFGNRKVVDVHNEGRPGVVRLVTNDGTFTMFGSTWVAPAGEYPLGES